MNRQEKGAMDRPGEMGIRDYHQRTKHAAGRYAAGPGYLDWDSQPDPFRRFEGARQVPLPLGPDRPTPPFARLGQGDGARLDAGALGLFLELALGLSAWKEAGGSRWALRNNPSSGNLHPTEGWVILPAVDGIGDTPALYHYSPYSHGLEERARLADGPGPEGFLVALSSIPWREAWKYGERAFRYCQHDVGHAVAAVAYASACLGWRARVLAGPGDQALGRLLGLDRTDAHHPDEGEHPDLIMAVSVGPAGEISLPAAGDAWFGRANRLGEEHHPWPIIDDAATATRRPEGVPVPPAPVAVVADLPSTAGEAAGTIIRRRRSAQVMDGTTRLGRRDFYRMLAATLPDPASVPWAAFPWPARLALAVFVHRVEGLDPGLYLLARDDGATGRMRAAMADEFLWRPVPGCPVPLFLLQDGDCRWAAAHLSCQQSIASDGAFSLGMVADFDRTLAEEGDWAYRRLFWEAGLIGQILYLEATAAGLSGTGIGCYHDDEMHQLLGLAMDDMAWQSLYHFTVGGAIEDRRIATLPAYAHRGVAGTL